MSQIIAGIYEIEKEIGSGGGGVVYLGRHIRLDKPVVLKADKRSLSVGEETLRREVDMLKNLSQTYIPQVYDFIEENGTVYTVMEYIDGVSLDKVLAWKKPLQQKEVIKWACQILEALNYLHTQKPHGILHGDIKPSNIMLRVNGDICLIDYNIALALGEDGAVKVGFSRGYASPEHYGLECEKTSASYDTEKTVVDTSDTSSMKKTVLLDTRSDIYSLGATLYHILSGQRPAQKATEVVKLSDHCCSKEVARIINKAMAADSDCRYQSAAEMLHDFLQLRVCDSRVKRYKRCWRLQLAASIAVFIVGSAITFVGMKQMENRQKCLKYASYAQEKVTEGNMSEALSLAQKAIGNEKSIFNAPVTAEVQYALTEALGVYDLEDGYKSLDKITLPSAPIDLSVSPDGTRYAVVYAYEVAVYEMEEKTPIVVLPMEKSALSDCVFIDENTICYASDEGITCYSLTEKKSIWKGKTATNLAVSGDKSRVAAVNRDDHCAWIYDTKSGKIITECKFGTKKMAVVANDTFADPKNYIFAMDEKGTQLAVSFSDGGLTIYNLKKPKESLIVFEKSKHQQFSGGFCKELFAYAANGEQHLFGVVDTKDAALIADMESENRFDVKADATGIYLSNGSLLEKIDTDTWKEKELAYISGQEILQFDVSGKYSVVAQKKKVSFYDRGANKNSEFQVDSDVEFLKITSGYAIVANRNDPEIRILKRKEYKNREILSYDPDLVHDEARISKDKKTIMLFNYEQFCIFNQNGEKLVQVTLPDAEQIYDQQYRRNKKGSYLEVTWYDGTIRTYGENGELISEKKDKAPSKELEETFLTTQYEIQSPLHDAPKVYDRKKGKLEKTLKEDAYLSYVTETDQYIVMQYVKSTGEKYGVLYDKKLQKLATLPYLADVYQNTLYFDYPSGEIRTCKIYGLEELKSMKKRK